MARRMAMIAVASTLVLAVTDAALGQRGRGPGFGRGQGRAQGLGRGPGGMHGPGNPRGSGHQRGLGRSGMKHSKDDRHEDDRQVFQFLLANHEKIRRTVTNLENGVETLTESDDPQVATMIQDHVEWMKVRVDETKPIRMRDPLFAEIFKHTDKIDMRHEDTKNGVKVIETSDDPYVVKLIQAHAEVVSKFVAKGHFEAMKNHAVPNREQAGTPAEAKNVAITGYGKVVAMPNAKEQPRDNTKICVDITAGNDPTEINPAFEKVAKYLNIYAAAGKRPAKASFSIVLHGAATLDVLHSEAYSQRFGTDGNPNFHLLHELHEQGVEIFVCGQSLVSKGGKREDVLVFTSVAVSALTAVVNHQQDGYNLIQLH